MPFTPIHMGPGILIKSLLQGSFSLMVFGWAQIVMDIQPLFVMLTGDGHLHGFSHTYVGATLLAVFAALSGRSLSEFGLTILRIKPANGTHIRWWVAFVSAFIGTYTHVLLDSVMHYDVEPFFPLSEQNGLYAIISVGVLHQLCLAAGVVGSLIFYAVAHLRRKSL